MSLTAYENNSKAIYGQKASEMLVQDTISQRPSIGRDRYCAPYDLLESPTTPVLDLDNWIIMIVCHSTRAASALRGTSPALRATGDMLSVGRGSSEFV